MFLLGGFELALTIILVLQTQRLSKWTSHPQVSQDTRLTDTQKQQLTVLYSRSEKSAKILVNAHWTVSFDNGGAIGLNPNTSWTLLQVYVIC